MSHSPTAPHAPHHHSAAPTPEPSDPSAQLWALDRDGRVQAMREHRLSFAQCMQWARKAPHEVPLLDGEWEFIARDTADVAG